MIGVMHRVNTISDLMGVPGRFGVEVDVRYEGKKLILHHDPYVPGEGLEEYLSHYKHRLIIFNLKTEGIEKDVVVLAEKFGIDNYFLLDVSAPFLVKLANSGLKKMAVRYSEYECIQTALKMAGKVDWVFVDTYTKLPLDSESYPKLHENFKICIVSPELWGRHDEIGKYKEQMKMNGIEIDAVVTKKPGEWLDG